MFTRVALRFGGPAISPAIFAHQPSISSIALSVSSPRHASSTSTSAPSSSIDAGEIRRFNALAGEWWDPNGPMRALHQLNPVRLRFIREHVDALVRDRESQSQAPKSSAAATATATTTAETTTAATSTTAATATTATTASDEPSAATTGIGSGSGIVNNVNRLNPFHERTNRFLDRPARGLVAADIGCGAGLLTEPIARLGAQVVGVDAAAENIRVAQLHASRDPALTDTLSYRHITVEELAAESPMSFDFVTAMEIVEHVTNVDDFIRSCCALLKPNGLLFLSTLNRTPESYAGAIVAAEYVLGLVPRGTHSWDKFVKPIEMMDSLRLNNMTVLQSSGVSFNPRSVLGVGDSWILSNNLDINYMMVARKLY